MGFCGEEAWVVPMSGSRSAARRRGRVVASSATGRWVQDKVVEHCWFP